MTINQYGALHLNKREARALAWRAVMRLMENNEDWLMWEDYPILDEASFMSMSEMMKGEMLDTMRHVDSMYNRQWNLDSADLEEQARG